MSSLGKILLNPLKNKQHRAYKAIPQAVLLGVVVTLSYFALINASENLARQGIASGFGFLSNTAGFDISQHLFDYSAVSTYGRAFAVGLSNTVLVAAIAIPLATALGFLVGTLRRSESWLLSRVAGWYVEIFRNTPLLLQLLFWYNAVLASLPERVADSILLPGSVYLNRRGLSLPQPQFGPLFIYVLVALAFALAVAIIFGRWARARQKRTGRSAPSLFVYPALILGCPLIVTMVIGRFTSGPVVWVMPELGRFSVTGGLQLYPELVALLLGLTIYTSASIAEVVRSGLQAVQNGQFEASHALGLSTLAMLRLIVIPQAMRVIIPPLTNQYLNLVKNSSLAVAIGYPDLVQVFAGTVLNQTGQAVEVIAMTMLVYFTMSIATSMAMNLYNRRIMLVEN